MPVETDRFDHSAGLLCLDFLNTSSTHEPLSREELRAFPDLVEWFQEFDLLQGQELEALHDLTEDRQAEELAGAIAFRESLFAVVMALVRGERAPAAKVTALLELAAQAIPNMHLATVEDDVQRIWLGRPEQPGSLLWPLAVDSAALLASNHITRVGECGGDDCQWVFLRQARGRQRRWCSMSDCGNRAKAKRHYERTKRASRADGQAGSNAS